MYIKHYDLYQFDYENFYCTSFCFKDDYIDCVTFFLRNIFPYDSAIRLKNKLDTSESFLKEGIVWDAEITVDFISNLIYLTYGVRDNYLFIDKKITPELIIENCLQGNLYYNVMTRDNFKFLVDAWAKLLSLNPPFALLYQDENDWYDVIPFDSKEAMEQFVQEHTESFYRSY